MRQGYISLCLIVVVLCGITGPAVAVSDNQPVERQSSGIITNAPQITQSTTQSAVNESANRVSQTSVSVDNEPNDQQTNATLIEDGEYMSLVSEADGFDYYAIDLTEDEELAVAIQYDDSVAELELGIEDSNGNYLSGSPYGDGTESAGIAAENDGTYYIRVENPDEADVNYDLLVATGENATASYGERFEPNYEQDIATHLDDGEYSSLTYEEDDSDYYAVDVTEGEGLAATIQYDDSVGELELAIEDSNGNYLTGSPYGDGTESAGIAVEDDGTYYIRVQNYDYDSSSNIEYDLLIETGDNATASYGERFEPNYEQNIATHLDNGEYLSLISENNDIDYYAVDVSDDEELEAAIDYDSTAGELELSIEDNNGNYLNGTSTDDGTGSTTVNANTGEIYYIVVENSGESEVQYDLSINPSASTTTSTATPTANTEAPTTATRQETTTDQSTVTQTQTRVPMESQNEDTTERVSTVEPDDTEPETTSGGSGPGFTGSVSISALAISVYIGIRRL